MIRNDIHFFRDRKNGLCFFRRNRIGPYIRPAKREEKGDAVRLLIAGPEKGTKPWLNPVTGLL